MITLKVTPEKAWHRLSTVDHKIFRRSLGRYWIVDDGGSVKAQSAFWLYCWAKTGMNSPEAAKVSRTVFDCIFDISFDVFDANVPHEWARKARYTKVDIDDQLAAYLR